MKLQIKIDGKTYEVEYDTIDGNSSLLPSVEHAQSLVLPTPQVPGSTETANLDESKLCRSPVAGIVVRIEVEPGQFLQAGDVIVVVEAMKMENKLTAAAAVKVSSVKVEIGDSVKLSQIVAEFE